MQPPASSCPICCETVSSWKTCIRPCCPQQNVCHSCMYQHMKSVFQEGLVGDGRKALLCPLGCGTRITDRDIRRTIQIQNFSIVRHLLGRILLTILNSMGYFTVFESFFPRRLKDPYSYHFTKLTLSSSEQDDLDMYERWNIALAMTKKQETERNENYIQCPAPDCDYMWIASSSHRNKKLVNEPDHHHQQQQQKGNKNKRRSHKSSKSSKTSEMVKTLSKWLTYSPPGLEKPTLLSKFWFDAEEIYYRDIVELVLQNPTIQRYPESKDGRRCICPKCHALFCGLCRRPWKNVQRGGGSGGSGGGLGLFFGQHKRISHDGDTCDSYTSKFEGNQDMNSSSFFAAQSINARMCPGCSMWVERISGCNHMTCRCGMEWCYVCETKWSQSHYSCVLRNNQQSNATWCVIS